MPHDLAAMADAFHRDGFLSPVPLLDSRDAAAQRVAMESVEAGHGSLDGVPKVHTLLDFAADLATEETVLDVIEAFLGPDILLLDVSYAIAEPGQKLDEPRKAARDTGEQVRMRLALSPVSDELAAGEAMFAQGGVPFPASGRQVDGRTVFLDARYASPVVTPAASGTETAVPVRGEDGTGRHDPEILATGVMEPEAVERHAALREGRDRKRASG